MPDWHVQLSLLHACGVAPQGQHIISGHMQVVDRAGHTALELLRLTHTRTLHTMLMNKQAAGDRAWQGH